MKKRFHGMKKKSFFFRRQKMNPMFTHFLQRRNIMFRRKTNPSKNKRKISPQQPIPLIPDPLVPILMKKEKLAVWVCSYGGSGSNLLSDYLGDKKKINTRPLIWKKLLCHYPKYIPSDIPTIYIYDDPRKSFCSMKRRGKGYWDTNQRKLSNQKNIELSDENLLRAMIEQFKNWTNSPHKDNVLFIDFRHFFTEETKQKIASFLKISTHDFPQMKSNIRKYDYSVHQALFDKYKDDIDMIISYHDQQKKHVENA